MITLAYILATLIIPALTLAVCADTARLEKTRDPDVRFDSEIDAESWAHVERSLYRLRTERVQRSDRSGRWYATVRDDGTTQRLARVVSSAAGAWYDLTDDPTVAAVEILRQVCSVEWDWTPHAAGWYAVTTTQ